MGKRVHYPAEIKWKAIKMFENGHSSTEISDVLGIKNSSQVRIWMQWYRNGETHRFEQPVGKQYTFNKGIGELTEIEELKLRVKQLEMQNELLGKLKGISRK
ncbi:helix-turn-helix domain-containing protein [Metabacillus litoralis]|jgi:transposase|uniref:helix-turn-helix domain-containing protein n=1 Tax=Metabacillus litoralis TaxID=152268 RepID=UPI00203D7C54|nr:helix-turn-helix domain-containing protein [Metabacillus litoralis]MCM3650372.1 helix-turn-helix domain-containing protein [Metabacillus litoralis]